MPDNSVKKGELSTSYVSAHGYQTTNISFLQRVITDKLIDLYFIVLHTVQYTVS